MRAQLYTLILEFRGGTYISQISASSPGESLKLYAKSLSGAEADAWKLDLSGFQAEVQHCEPVPFEGLINAWCLSGDIGGHFMLINIIQTDRSQGTTAPA